MGEFRTLKIIAVMACVVFAFVWAWISIATLEMYIPDAKIMSFLTATVFGRLLQTYAERPKTKEGESL